MGQEAKTPELNLKSLLTKRMEFAFYFNFAVSGQRCDRLYREWSEEDMKGEFEFLKSQRGCWWTGLKCWTWTKYINK